MGIGRRLFDGLYVTYLGVVFVGLQLPWWTISSVLPLTRPRRSWSFMKCIRVNFIRYYMNTVAQVPLLRPKTPNYLAIETGPSVKGVWVGSSPELVIGDVKRWAEAASVESVRIPGYWIDKKGLDIPVGSKPTPDEKIVYFLHGGAYISLSAHPSAPTSNIPRGILKYCQDVRRVFSLEYRLSAGPPRVAKSAGAFPSALVDAISGYNYLINVVGCAPENIIVAGDSAGGNLALALTRYLVENAFPSHPIPHAMILFSPWCDLSRQQGAPEELRRSSLYANTRSDYLAGPNAKRPNYAVQWFLGPQYPDGASSNPYISPACPSLSDVSFKGFPKTFITAGDAELILDQIRVLNGLMKAQLGEDSVAYHEARDSVHDYVVFSWHEPQRSETLAAISAWVARL